MGQPIQVEATQIDDVVLFDTDRSITGQDGTWFESQDAAEGSDRFPAQLAVRLFEADDAIDHVFVASNQVVVRRSAAWEAAQVEASGQIIADFFLYYPDAAGV